MALFGKKTTTEKKKDTAKDTAVAVLKKEHAPMVMAVADIIARPHITEKAGIQNETLNVYTFQVAPRATKHTVARAIHSLYKVTPSKVRIVNLPAKKVLVRGKRGTQSAIKKAFVFLKKGDKIEVA